MAGFIYRHPTLGFFDLRYLKLDGSNDPITGDIKINTNSTTAFFVEQDGVKDNVLVVNTTSGRIGINCVPTYTLSIAHSITSGTTARGIAIDVTSSNAVGDALLVGISCNVLSHNTFTETLGIWQTGYAIYGGFEDSCDITYSNAAAGTRSAYGLNFGVTTSSANLIATSGALTNYYYGCKVTSSASSLGTVTGPVFINNYAGHFTATGQAVKGTTSAIGVYTGASGANTNYDIVLDGAGNIMTDLSTGKLTLGGINNTNNENLILDFETTNDSVIFTSTGATLLNFSALNLLTTGTLGAGAITGTSIIKSGGTSAQFLKANGSVDSSTYLDTTTAASTYVPYTGATTDVNLNTRNFLTTGTLGAGVSTLAGNNGNAAFTLLNLNNNFTPLTTQVDQTANLVFNLTQSVNSVVSLHEAARISAYKASDWFHATTEADTDSGLKFYTTLNGTPTLQLTLDEAGLATFAGNIYTTGNITGAYVYTDYIYNTGNTAYLAFYDGENWILGNVFSVASDTFLVGINGIQPKYSADPIPLSGFVAYKAVSAITATHSPLTQGEGLLTGNINQISVCANANDVVTLPPAIDNLGYRIVIMNDGAQTVKVWASSADKIDGADYSTIAAGATAEFISYDSTNWNKYTL